MDLFHSNISGTSMGGYNFNKCEVGKPKNGPVIFL